MYEHSNLLLKGTATVAGIGMVLGALHEGRTPLASAADHRPSDGAVVYSGEGTVSPTDPLANQLAQLQAVRDESMKNGPDLAALEKRAGTLAVGAAALTTTIQFMRAEKTLPFPDQGGDDELSIGAGQVQNAANQIADPTIREKYVRIFTSGVIKKVLDSVSVNKMEQDEARILLDSVKPGLSQHYTRTLDELDVSDAVITNYSDPAAILPDISDVRNPALKAKATKYANTSWGSKANQKLYEELIAQTDSAKKVADVASHAYSTDTYVQERWITESRLVDVAARKAIIKHNAVTTAPDAVTLPPLANPSERIDLRQVAGPKKYYSALEPKDPPLAQFAEIYVEDGTVAFRFEDGSNVPAEAAAQMQRIVGDVTPLLANAFQKGDLLSVRFIIGEYYHPYFTSRAKEVHMLLSANDPLSEEQLRQGLVHEITHSMVDASFGEEILSEEEAGLVKKACTMLSSEAYSQYAQALKLSPDALQRMIDKTDGDEKKLFVQMKELANNGGLAKAAEDSMASSVANKRDIAWTDCNNHYFGDLMVNIGYDAQITDPNKVYNNILKKYLPDPVSSSAVSDGNTMSSQTTVPSNDPDLYGLIESWSDVIHKYSLFERLNEASFVRTDSETKEYLGHSRDNAHELMATVFDVSLSNPTELKQLLSGLNKNQRAAVNAAIQATYTIVISRHPALKANLDAWHEQFSAIK